MDPGADARWRTLRAQAKVFLQQQRRWAPVGAPGVFLDDIANGAVTSVAADLGLALATPGHLGTARDDQVGAARQIGLALLSSRFRVAVRPAGELPVPPCWQQGFGALQAQLRERLSQPAGDDAADSEQRAGAQPILELAHWQSLRTVVFDEDNEVRQIPSDAATMGEAVAVAGEPEIFAEELCRVVFERWGLHLRRDLMDLLPRFAIRLSQIGREEAVREWLSAASPGQPAEHVSATPPSGGAEQPATPSVHPAPSGPSPEAAVSPSPPVSPPAAAAPPAVASPPARSGGGYTMSDRDAQMQAAVRRRDEADARIRGLATVGVLPPEQVAEHESGGGEFRDDELQREAVLQFERDNGRFPVNKPSGQRGHDIDSYSHAPGHPERSLVRRIEVKGKGVRWDDEEIVVLSRPQFEDACLRAAEETKAPDFDYWLYVAEDDGQGHYSLVRIRNPANAAAGFAFRGGTWRDLAERDPHTEIPDNQSSDPKPQADDREN